MTENEENNNKEKHTIFFHHDPDGLVSAYFTHFAYPNYIMKTTDNFGDTKNFKKGDIMVDMRPDNPNIDGLVIDHHPGHAPLAKRKYKLIWDKVPASLICWRQFKDKIPKKHWWKVAIGLLGDGQPELIPYEVFESCPELLKTPKSYMACKYNKWSASFFPVYKGLSSAVNSYARFGDMGMAMDLIKDANRPMDITTSLAVKKQKKKVKDAFDDAMERSYMEPFGNSFYVIIYESRTCRLSGYIASVLQSSFRNATVLAINKINGSASMRGDLALYYKGKLASIKYLDIDGHPGFMGGKLKGTTDKLLEDLSDIL